MAVFVDEPIYRLGRMRMCHMIADSKAELLHIATQIGLDHRWIQHPDTHREHFDVCKSKRSRAIQLGAIPVTGRAIVLKMREKLAEKTEAAFAPG